MEASATTPPRPARSIATAEGSEWLRIFGGLAFAVGAVVLYIRKEGFLGGSDWADFPLLLVAGVPCALLFWLGARGPRGAQVERWRATFLVVGVVLAPLALEQLREAIGFSEHSSFWHFLVFVGTGAMAGYAAFVVGASYQAFLAAVAGIIAWLFLWDWIASPGVNGFRWLLIVLGIGYLGAAIFLRSAGRAQGDEVVTAAALVGLSVGFIGVAQASLQALVGTAFGGIGGAHGQGFFWDLVLLVVSLAAIGYAAVSRVRGPAYVGFLGLSAFVLLVGVEINSIVKGDTPDGSFVGWPLVLLLLGGAALALGMVAERRRAGQGPRRGDSVYDRPRQDLGGA